MPIELTLSAFVSYQLLISVFHKCSLIYFFSSLKSIANHHEISQRQVGLESVETLRENTPESLSALAAIRYVLAEDCHIAAFVLSQAILLNQIHDHLPDPGY